MDALCIEETIGNHDRRRLKISGTLLSIIDSHVQKAAVLAPYDGMFVVALVIAQLETGETLIVGERQ